MKTMTEPGEDLPKTVATVMVAIPSLVVRTGFAYLMTKRKARKGARLVEKGMVENGVPPELARRLSEEYESDLSLHKIMRGVILTGRNR